MAPPELKGQTFRDVYREGSTTGAEASFPFKTGEEGIWTVVPNTKGELWPEYHERFPFRSRSRKADNQRYPHHVKLAEAVEAIGGTKGGERVKALIGLAKDDTPEVATWAVTALGASDDPAATKFLEEFADKPDLKLPVAAQVAIDQILSTNKRDDWQRSKGRVEVIRGWVSGKADEYVGMQVLRRLDAADQNEELRNQTACELIIVAAENKDWPWKTREYAISLVGTVASRVVDDAAAFDWLFGQVRHQKDVAGRRAAAIALTRLPLYPKRLKAVEERLVTETDKEVTKVLEEAVKKAKESK